jgi:ABC-type phosphate/phosphonate transport system substrate-binding protein
MEVSKDKNFNTTLKLIVFIIACIATIASITIAVVRYLKSEMKEEIKNAISEVVYDIKQLKGIKETVERHDSQLSLLTYRMSALEAISKYGTLPNSTRLPEPKETELKKDEE